MKVLDMILFTVGLVCDDIDATICGDIQATIPDMCQDPCLSNLCRRFCGICPLKCYSCDEIQDHSRCNKTTLCPSADEFCIVTQTFNAKFEEVYRQGCAASHTCVSNFFDNNVIGRSAERSFADVYGGCCASDMCNNQNPSSMLTGESRSTMTPAIMPNVGVLAASISNDSCADIDHTVCSSIASVMPNMCSSDCIASRICPRHCNKCVQCYSCTNVTDPANCNQTTVCSKDQTCHIFREHSQQHVLSLPKYSMGCKSKTACSLAQPSTIVIGRRQSSDKGHCCDGSLCNNNAHMPSMPGASLTTHPPEPSTGTPSTTGTCQQHYNTCPHNFHPFLHSCYHLGSFRETYENGKLYCQKLCSQLANISQTNVNSLGYFLFNLYRFGQLHAFVDVQKVPGLNQQHNLNMFHNVPQCTIIFGLSPLGHYVYSVPQRENCLASHNILCEIKNVG